MRVVSVVGARPQFVKLEPIHEALVAAGHDHLVVHTGQHYDHSMSQVFFDGLRLPPPRWNLGVGSASAPAQTAQIMVALEPVLMEARPDWILVYGDTNSTLAAALTAAQLRMRIAHVEAGLRSFNRDMPEEFNRVQTDHASGLLLAPTLHAVGNLEREGLGSRAHLTGDVMADLTLKVRSRLEQDGGTQGADAQDSYVVVTIHRASNTDDVVQLRRLLSNLQSVHARVVLVAHPRLRERARGFNLEASLGRFESIDPLPYLEMIELVSRSRGVVTDSGGLQKEACMLGVPCTTLRAETEWPETLEDGRNVLDPQGSRLDELATRAPSVGEWNPYQAGRAARNIVSLLAP